MAKALVKCLYCGETFDRNDSSIEWVKPTARRYAHKACADKHDKNMSQDEKDEASLYKYIKELLGNSYEYMRVKKQVEKYRKEYHYSFSGIEKTLRFFYEIKGNSIDKANGGIGIVPYVYNQAYDYFYKLYLAQNANRDVVNYKPKVETIIIKSPRTTHRQPRLFDIDKENDSDT